MMVQYSKCPYGLFSYCKSQAFTLNTLWGVCKIYAKSTFFRFSKEGGGGWTLILSLCNQISFSTFDLRFALLVPPQSENASYTPAFKLSAIAVQSKDQHILIQDKPPDRDHTQKKGRDLTRS